MTVNLQKAAADRYLALYDNFYLAQHQDKKAKFIFPVNCKSLIYKQNGDSQQAAFRHSQGAWNHLRRTLFGFS